MLVKIIILLNTLKLKYSTKGNNISMKIYNGAEELIGNTPLVYIEKFCKAYGIDAKILLKMESYNPAGSAKDRVALAMITDAEKKGLLKKGGVIIEPTSGNTGIGLAAIGTAKGYRVILTMPDTMSIERRNLLKAYGAEVVLTPGADGMSGAIRKAEELRDSIPGAYIPGQFDNNSNPQMHYNTTGPEIWRDTEGSIDAFVAGIGTGGTLSGCATYLKEKNSAILTIGVEPAESPLITEGRAGAHKIQGIGANFIPKNYNPDVVDLIIDIEGASAYNVGRNIAKTEGILIGISGAAAVSAAIQLVSNGGWEGKNVVCIIPDSGEHYLSTPDYLI